MATYDYRCPVDGTVTVRVPMAQVSATHPCPICEGPARRVFSAPQLRLGDASARRLLDATSRSAHEPEVVTSLPGRPRGPRRPTADPRTARLPRP